MRRARLRGIAARARRMPRALRGAGLPPPLAAEGRGGGESALEVTRAADTVVPGKQYIGVTPAGPLRNSSPRPPRGRGKSQGVGGGASGPQRGLNAGGCVGRGSGPAPPAACDNDPMSARSTQMKRLVSLVVLGAFSLSACAQQPSQPAKGDATGPAAGPAPRVETRPGTPEDRARQAVESLDRDIRIERIAPAPLPGFTEVIVHGQALYVSADGRYILPGPLYDADGRKDLSEPSVAAVRRALLAQIPRGDRIVFAPANPKYRVTVFTDVECGFCRRLHSQIAEYNRLGIAVEYVAFPRMGLGSEDYRTMVSVWCASDRRKALTDAKNGKPVPRKNCTNPVAIHYDIGQRIGLTGTPLIVTEGGGIISGYLAPRDLLERLRKLEQADASAAGSR